MDDVLSILGYGLVKHDQQSRGGGVAVYKKIKNCEIIKFSFGVGSPLATIFLKCTVRKSMYVIGTSYHSDTIIGLFDRGYW